MPTVTLGRFQCDQSRDGLVLVLEPGHPVKPGDVLRRLAFFEVGLHGSEMVLARDFQGFCTVQCRSIPWCFRCSYEGSAVVTPLCIVPKAARLVAPG